MSTGSGGASGRAQTGREAQRRRTRAAIVDAATRLLIDGTPTIDDVALSAEVSRRTVYMHFASLDQLLLDAAVGAMSRAVVDAAIESAAGRGDAVERVQALIGAIVRSAPQTLPLGRKIIALTVDPATPAAVPVEASPAEAGESAARPRRGYRRVEWIHRALEPLRDHVTDDAYERLVSSLTLVVGWEALIVLRDLRALDADAELATLNWTAATLIRAALDA